jgi:hypothetical protein
MKMADARAFVPPAVASKIAAIEAQAKRLGWQPARLLNPNLDDYGRPQGLAAVLEPSDAIVDVKRKYIIVRKNRFHELRFPRG